MSIPVDIALIIAGLGGDSLDLPFWEACREGRFLLHRCGVCGNHYWPASRCVSHGDLAMSWVETSGTGVLYTYTVMHHAYTAAMKNKVPYVVGVVQLTEGPFFHANIIDCPLDQVNIGMSLQSVMTSHETGLVVPMFRPAASDAG